MRGELPREGGNISLLALDGHFPEQLGLRCFASSRKFGYTPHARVNDGFLLVLESAIRTLPLIA